MSVSHLNPLNTLISLFVQLNVTCLIFVDLVLMPYYTLVMLQIR
jgi:hypothetical protein